MIQPDHSDNAIYGSSSYGPTFGGSYDHDIYIQDVNYGSYSYINSYTPPTTFPPGSEEDTFLTGGWQNWLTTEIEVYQLFT